MKPRRRESAKPSLGKRRPPASGPETPFAIVGIGASAGGLEALSQLLSRLPADTGMAFVVVQHLDPHHPSLLGPSLAQITALPVVECQQGLRLEPNTVYVIPPGAALAVEQGAFMLTPRGQAPGGSTAIDHLFASLAAERGEGAIGVVLSGTGSDGTAGLRAIKAGGGITLAQKPETARFSGMPQSALDGGVVDLCMTPAEIGDELVRLSRHPYVSAREAVSPVGQREHDGFLRILQAVRNATGADLAGYKDSTIRRRLARRMVLQRIGSIDDYLSFLERTPGEAQALFEDVLVHVTSFFRDAAVFEAVREKVLPALVASKAQGSRLRVWVPGCSTGEEAYTLAMVLLEFFGGLERLPPTQIFASDISERAIEKARRGLYTENELSNIEPERLARYFTRAEGGYRINKALRELCVFIRHDLTKDPPLSRMDLISCRNVLIYFGPALQRKVLTTFHYSLNQPGFLVLGRSESAYGFDRFLAPVDKHLGLFSRVPAPGDRRLRELYDLSSAPILATAQRPPSSATPPAVDLTRQVDQFLLARYAPPGVVVNDKMEILQFRGRTGAYLEPAPGQPQASLLKMARTGLLSELREAVQSARKQRGIVRRTNVQVHYKDYSETINLEVSLLSNPAVSEGPLFLIVFEEAPTVAPEKARPRAKGAKRANGRTARIGQLEHELIATKEYLQTLLEDHEKINEQLTSANEELSSSNEELQSLNEELETAQEELQSTNEELTTVNEELQSRNEELSRFNNDLINLLNSVEIPIVILDARRHIRRFTPRSRGILNLIPGDVGRSIDDIRSNLDMPELGQLVTDVIDTAAMKELEVQDRDGRWYRMQIRPYITTENKIDGAVVSIVDIDKLKEAVREAEWARDYARGTVEAVQVPLVVMGENLRILSANPAFYQKFGGSPADVEQRSFFDLPGDWDVPAVRSALEEAIAKGGQFHGLEIERELPRAGQRLFTLTGRAFAAHAGMKTLLLSLEDITERRRAEDERLRLLGEAHHAREEAERANQAKDIFLATLSHELRTPMSSILLRAQMMLRSAQLPERQRHSLEALEQSARAQAQLIDDLLDVSRIVSGKLKLERLPVDLLPVVRAAVAMVETTAEAKHLALETALANVGGIVFGDPKRLQQVVWNLLTNAIKFTPEGGHIAVSVERAGDKARLEVRDTGAGIPPSLLQYVFDRFTQVNRSSTGSQGGLGLGLAIVRHVVEQHGGQVWAESEGVDHGSTFIVELPLVDTAAVPPFTAQRPALGAQDPAVSSELLKGIRLLVVEDDPNTREAICEVLTSFGAEVRAVGSVEAAMQALASFVPTILLSDLSMPGEDGYGLLRRVRKLKLEDGGQMPAVALTARATSDEAQKALEAGFQRYLVKPVSVEHLVTTVAELARPSAQAV